MIANTGRDVQGSVVVDIKSFAHHKAVLIEHSDLKLYLNCFAALIPICLLVYCLVQGFEGNTINTSVVLLIDALCCIFTFIDVFIVEVYYQGGIVKYALPSSTPSTHFLVRGILNWTIALLCIMECISLIIYYCLGLWQKDRKLATIVMLCRYSILVGLLGLQVATTSQRRGGVSASFKRAFSSFNKNSINTKNWDITFTECKECMQTKDECICVRRLTHADIDKLQCEDTTRLVVFVPRATLVRQLSHDSFLDPTDDAHVNVSPGVSVSEVLDSDTVQREGEWETGHSEQEQEVHGNNKFVVVVGVTVDV